MYVPPTPPRPKPSRRRVLLIGAAAVGLLLLTMAFVAWAGGAQKPAPRQVVAIHLAQDGRRRAAFADVHIGDKGPFQLLIDTGASTSMVEVDTANTLDLSSADASALVRGVGRAVAMATVAAIRRWHTGDIRLPDGDVLVTDLPRMLEGQPTVDGRRTAGLLGSDVLSGLGIVTIDFLNQQLITHDTPTGAAVPIVVTRGGHSVSPFVYVRIRDRGPYLFLIDTGAEVSTIDPATAADLGLRETGHMVSVAGFGGARNGQEVTVDAWRLGDIDLPAADIAAVAFLNVTIVLRSGNDDVRPVGVLGADVLAIYASISLDYTKERLYVGPVR